MTHRDLIREIARVTGESPETIRDLGFVPRTRVPFEREALAFDWDTGEPASLSALDADLAMV